MPTSPALSRSTSARAWRVEVFKRPDLEDPEARLLLASARELGLAGLERARSGRGYLLAAELEREAVERIVRELLADPVADRARISAPGERPRSEPGTRLACVMRKPGVMDPIAGTVRRALARAALAPREVEVATFRVYELEGALTREELALLARRALANETVDELFLENEELGFPRGSPAARRGRVEIPLTGLDDAGLERLSREGGLALSVLEMRAIQAHHASLGREPSLAELETVAQTWSEHCKHKTFSGPVRMGERRWANLFKETIVAATRELARPWCVSVFHDNAGIVEFDRGFDLAFKVETHNHPSAIDPYGGAGTGVGGVIRDVLGVGLGAKPIANLDAFFVGPPDLPPERLPPGTLPSARILRGVVAGVRDYGNRMGIPTVVGGVWFHEGYVANPLVFAGTVGLLPHSAATKEVLAGDVILLVGGRTGRDGIHGATFSSEELHEASERESGSAVQIGDPITEKRVQDALLVARDRGLYRALTDCGAGGLSSAVGEMALGERVRGAEVLLERVPLKYEGLAPEEIWISEAQERMVLAVPPERLEECRAVFEAEDVDATAIGRFTDTGLLVLRHAGESIAELELEFLHEGLPRFEREARWDAPAPRDPPVPALEEPAALLLRVLAAPDVASKEWILRQYDHEVQGTSVVKPLVGARGDAPSDGAVLRPLASSMRGIALAVGASPRYGLLDPGAMAEAVIDEALRNVVALGGDPARTAILDNFSWGNCDKPDRLGALVLAAEGCKRAALAYGTPFISGKDSLNNEYKVGGRSLPIPPTLLISALSIVPDLRRAVTMDAKRAGSTLYQVGATGPDLGGSHLFEALGLEGGRVPRPDLGRAPRLMAALHAALAEGLALACHDLSEGGLACCAAEMAFGGELGLELELEAVPLEGLRPGDEPATVALFSESSTRWLVEVAAGSEAAFERRLAGLPHARIGRVLAEPILSVRARAGGPALLELATARLRAAFRSGFAG